MKLKIFGLLIVVLAMAACNAVENQSTSGTMLQIISLTGRDLKDTEDTTTAFCDVETNGSIFNDNGKAIIKALPLDPLMDKANISPYMDVLVDQIDIEFRRTDGRNVEGVDVPYRFTQPISVLLPVSGEATEIAFILIRHVAKLEAPLLALREVVNQGKILQLVAVVTIHGKDKGGHRVAPVTGYITVWCANFADENSTPTPPPTTTGK